MQDLVGRISALDAEATETLKVISYFDSLIASGVGVEPMLRAAAVLSGVAVGASIHGRLYRFSPDGARLDPPPVNDASRPDWNRREIDSGEVWIEREPPCHANDPMVIERLAMSIEIVEDRRTQPGRTALEIACEAGTPQAERVGALARLGIDPARMVRIVAQPEGSARASVLRAFTLAQCTVATSRGLVRVGLTEASTSVPNELRLGLGLETRAIDLPTSLESAILALCVSVGRSVDAAELGAALWLLDAAQSHEESHPDVQRLAELTDRELSLRTLDALAEHDTVRGAASSLGLHHSTVQHRVATLTRELGYDVRTSSGRTRYVLARLLDLARSASFE